MKRIIDFSLNNKLAVWILSIIVIFTGIYSGLNMKQEAIPDISLPNLSIVTTYPGAAPDVVADDVTTPIEQLIQNVDNVEITMSSSYANASSVMVQFDYGTDMDKAEQNVKDVLSNLSLPEMAEEPDVMRISIDAMPVMAASISDESKSAAELTELVEKEILPKLDGINGLSEAEISGQQAEEVSVVFDEDALEEYNLTEEEVEQIIQASNLVFPLGLTTFDKTEKNVVIDGNIISLKDLKNIAIPYTPNMPDTPDMADMQGMPDMADAGDMMEMPEDANQMDPSQMEAGGADAAAMDIPTVAFSELAEIELVSKATSISRTNGEDSIGLQIVKAPQANTVEVVNNVKDTMNELEKEFGFTWSSTFDQAEPIEDSISMMIEKAIFGIIFAVIVILLFLRNFRTTIISILSIPLSLLMALFLLHQMDVTLNILTLGALTVAIGRVIDDSIVVMENIYRRMSLENETLRGKSLFAKQLDKCLCQSFHLRSLRSSYFYRLS